MAARWRTVTRSLIAVHSYSHWSIFNQAFAVLRSRELSSVWYELTLELWAAEINAIWNRGRARDYNFKSTYVETYFAWHGTLKFMVHSLYLFLERLHGMWFFPLAEKYGFFFFVRSSQDAFCYLYFRYNLIETYFLVSSWVRVAATWLYELIHFQSFQNLS